MLPAMSTTQISCRSLVEITDQNYYWSVVEMTFSINDVSKIPRLFVIEYFNENTSTTFVFYLAMYYVPISGPGVSG